MTGSEEQALVMELATGEVRITLWPDIAPAHVARVLHLAATGAYDGIVFHRVIPGFVAQTGDVTHGHHAQGSPRLAGTGGSGLPDLALEPSGHAHSRATLGMARSAAPDSANAQFFVNLADNNFLNGQYTVFAEVTDGMDHIDALPEGEPPARPAHIRRLRATGAG